MVIPTSTLFTTSRSSGLSPDYKGIIRIGYNAATNSVQWANAAVSTGCLRPRYENKFNHRVIGIKCGRALEKVYSRSTYLHDRCWSCYNKDS